MIRAWRYREAVAGAEDISPDSIAGARTGAGTLLLVDVDDPTRDEVRKLCDALPIHPLAAEDLLNAHQRTKLQRYGDHWHVAVHECDVSDREVQTREVDVVFGEDWMLMVRQPGDDGIGAMPFDSVKRRFEAARMDARAEDLGFAVWALLDVVVDGYFSVTDLVDDRLDTIEDIVFGDGGRDEIPQEVFTLRSSLVRFRRASAPLREVLNELLRRNCEVIGPETIIRLQDVYDHALRIADLVDSQRDLLTGLLEAHLAVVSNHMNQVMKLTSSWGAILLVATLIAGIYGMNFRHMPELHWRYGYFIALGLMAALTLVLYRAFRKRGWL